MKLLQEMIQLAEIKRTDDGDEAWEKSKWYPEKLSRDSDPKKVTFNNVFKDAFKFFPASIREWFTNRGFNVGGNGIFDTHIPWQDLGEPFEEDFCSAYNDTGIGPQDLYDDLQRLGAFLTSMEATLETMKPAYDKLDELDNNPVTKTQLVRIFKNLKGLQLIMDGQKIEFFTSREGRSGEKRDSERLPLFIHHDGKSDPYRSLPRGVPYTFNTRWLMQYMWDALTRHFSIYEILTGVIELGKVKAVPHPVQENPDELEYMYGVKETRKSKAKVSEAIEKPKFTKFPDTKAGALAFLKDPKEVKASFAKELDLPTCLFFPDPQVAGVWGVDSVKTGQRVIIYMGGYKGPMGDLRDYNDFEEGEIPIRDIRKLAREGKVKREDVEKWDSVDKSVMAKLENDFDD